MASGKDENALKKRRQGLTKCVLERHKEEVGLSRGNASAGKRNPFLWAVLNLEYRGVSRVTCRSWGGAPDEPGDERPRQEAKSRNA